MSTGQILSCLCNQKYQSLREPDPTYFFQPFLLFSHMNTDSCLFCLLSTLLLCCFPFPRSCYLFLMMNSYSRLKVPLNRPHQTTQNVRDSSFEAPGLHVHTQIWYHTENSYATHSTKCFACVCFVCVILLMARTPSAVHCDYPL